MAVLITPYGTAHLFDLDAECKIIFMSILINDCVIGEGEYNLLNMYKSTLIEAFRKIPIQTNRILIIADALGVSSRQVYRMINIFDLQHLNNKKKN